MRRFAVGLAARRRVAAAGAGAAETAVLAGGCFWGMESVFEHVKGVTDVVSGYAGGSARDANYDGSARRDTATPRRSRSPTIRARSAMASCSRSTSPSPTTRPR